MPYPANKISNSKTNLFNYSMFLRKR